MNENTIDIEHDERTQQWHVVEWTQYDSHILASFYTRAEAINFIEDLEQTDNPES